MSFCQHVLASNEERASRHQIEIEIGIWGKEGKCGSGVTEIKLWERNVGSERSRQAGRDGGRCVGDGKDEQRMTVLIAYD